jgi:hypothetical protein
MASSDSDSDLTLDLVPDLAKRVRGPTSQAHFHWLSGLHPIGAGRSCHYHVSQVEEGNMIKLDANTFWLDLHGVLMFVVLLFSAFLVGCIYFVKDPDDTIVSRLKISATVSFVLLMGLMISGIVPDTAFGSGATFTH